MALNGKAVVFMYNLVGLNFLIVPQTQEFSTSFAQSILWSTLCHKCLQTHSSFSWREKKIRNRGYGVTHLQFK